MTRRHSTPAGRPALPYLPALLLLPLLAGLWLSGRWWWAERLNVQVSTLMQPLQQQRNNPQLLQPPALSRPQWDSMAALAQHALSLRPSSSVAWFNLAEVQELRQLAPVLEDPEALLQLDLAQLFAPFQQANAASLEALRELVKRQPGMPVNWARLAARKVELGQYDAELLQALRLAEATGPHFIVTQLNLTRIVAYMLPNLAGYIGLEDFARHYLQRVLQPGATAPAQQLQLLRQIGSLPQACLLLQLDSLVEEARAACRIGASG